MNIYKLTRIDDIDYDEYDSAVVIAKTREDAIMIHPSPYAEEEDANGDLAYGGWTTTENVKVEYVGRAPAGAERGVVLASFNAG